MIITINTTSRTSRIVFNITLFIFGALLCGTAAYSWTGPTSTPSDGNVSAPINVGTLSQIKDGALSVNGFSNTGSSYIAGNLGVGVANPAEKLHVVGSAYITGQLGIDVTNPAQKVHVDGRVRATGFCINGSCITSWPEEGSYGASTWSAWVAHGTSPTCASGRVMTGLQIQMHSLYGISQLRILCRVLTP
jgi:hypothetical protein